MSRAALESSCRCRKCGKEASEACSVCHEARYCCKACQKFDWKEGYHKALCRGPASGRKIHTILRELFVAEWQWLKSLSTTEKEVLFQRSALNTPLNHLFLAGEVALVLARANPCAVLSNFRKQHTKEYGVEYYRNVIAPWYGAHQEFLNEQGFYIEFLFHAVFVADRPCQCPTNGLDQPCGEQLLTMAVGAALVKDVRSEKIGLVDKVFGTERSSFLKDWTEEEKAVTWNDMMKCTFIAQTREGIVETGSEIHYYFQYPKQIFGDVQVCCSPAFSSTFLVDPQDATALGEHFYLCYTAMAAIGFPITLAIIHNDDWPVSAIADTWWAASGNNLGKFLDWIRNKTGIVTYGMTRFNTVITRVYARAALMWAERQGSRHDSSMP